MIAFGAPGALVAGAMLAGFVFVLHLLAPRPPDRAPLPTARFLREDARSTLRFRRRPTDPGVLALRMLLALLLGALFSAPRWRPDREDGSTRVVLLDRGAGMAGVWAEARAAAAREAGVEGTWIVPFASVPGTAVPAADTSAVAEQGTTGEESSYLVALRALRGALPHTTTRDVEAVLITRPRWSAWDAQLGLLRAEAWPGPLRVVAVGEGAAGGEDPSGRTPGADAHRTGPAGAPGDPSASTRGAGMPAGARVDPGAPAPLRAALEVLGYRVAESAPEGDAPTLHFVSVAAALQPALDRARRLGDTVLVVAPAADALPPPLNALWDAEGWATTAAAAAPSGLRVGNRRLPLHDARLEPGRAAAPAEGRLLPVVRVDGGPVAAALPWGAGCVVRYGAPWEAGREDPSYPALIRTLVDGCRSADDATGADAALDEAARALLAGGAPAPVAAAALGPGPGRPLEGWLLAAALLVAVAETVRVTRLERGRRS
ncbi:MAG: BatA domain-containing protein [Gemmatimonadota bacterium]